MHKDKKYSDLSRHEIKKLKYKIRASVYLQGKLKDLFMQECIDKNLTESDTLVGIIKKHYHH